MMQKLASPLIHRDAKFSRCKTYRYSLSRRWQADQCQTGQLRTDKLQTDEALKRVVFIGLNPSTADHRVDDPTIRRCMSFAKSWGYNAVTVVNLFAYRTPYPSALKKARDPIGPYNSKHLNQVIRESDLAIACWGRDGGWLGQDVRLAKRLIKRFNQPLHCLAINADGSPAHPLYQRGDTIPRPWVFEHG